MMNKLFSAAVLACALSTNANAGAEYATSFNIVGGLGPDDLRSVELDIEIGKRYMAVNGVATTAQGLSYGVAGSCFTLAGGGVLCTVGLGHLTLSINLNSSLSGVIRLTDAVGGVIDDAAVTLTEIY
jgi:hypothetical protein